ncbi:MAG: hypothetical protein AAFV88_04310 [Planctomycetota bacterium]
MSTTEDISAAVADYLDAQERFNTASKWFAHVCKTVRDVLGKQGQRNIVVLVGTKKYLVVGDSNGFRVEPFKDEEQWASDLDLFVSEQLAQGRTNAQVCTAVVEYVRENVLPASK